MLPYEVSVAIWYFFSVLCLGLAVHWLASALESHLSGPLAKRPPPGCARWWALRMIPTLVCIMSVGSTLSRGQVNLLVLLLFCGMAALSASDRRVLAGACLAAAASIKLFPAYLGLYFLSRRDWRAIAGMVAGFVFCLILVPVLALGPQRTVACYEKYYTVLLAPAFGSEADKSRASELLNATSTDSQSFMVLIHNTLHPHWASRPAQVQPWVRTVHWALAGIFSGITLWFGRRKRQDDMVFDALFLGCLIVVMLPISPVSHSHYFVFALPLVMALTVHAWERHQAPVLSRGYQALFAAHLLLVFIAKPVSLQLLKDLGVGFYGTIILWGAGIEAMRQRRKA